MRNTNKALFAFLFIISSGIYKSKYIYQYEKLMPPFLDNYYSEIITLVMRHKSKIFS